MKKLSRLFLLPALVVPCLFTTGCFSDDSLLVLNWGEYINDDLVEAFEKEYNCSVSISITESNELFYSKVKSKTTAYDIVVPSDYMVQKMADKKMIDELDFSKLTNYQRDRFLPGVNGILDEMDKEGDKTYSSYCVPYFWGSFGLMYNKRIEGLEETVNARGWDAYFDPSLDVRVGMYNVPRDAYAATMFYHHLSPNEINDDLLDLAYDSLTQRKFASWGTDTLKKEIVAGNLDLAFVYTGDYLDMAYEKVSSLDELDNLNFGIYIPDETIAFMDTMVVPSNSRHKDLAYKFMDFFLRDESAYENASVVGYCTPLVSSYDHIIAGMESDDDWLQVWGKMNSLCYPKTTEDGKNYLGTPLTYFSEDELTKVSNVVNNAKVR